MEPRRVRPRSRPPLSTGPGPVRCSGERRQEPVRFEGSSRAAPKTGGAAGGVRARLQIITSPRQQERSDTNLPWEFVPKELVARQCVVENHMALGTQGQQPCA